ncbi:uncharacterized protein LOC132186151 [Corylus avellana]|uniref:uncharacterized protein LOC132186151 n=1 Tax=Corylus avellana TaxID=13451 RepID=UPI00286AB414|nr:uncharacterized protein LOC132186151 [Corylus avellana]
MAAYCSVDGTILRFQHTRKAVEKDHTRNRTPHFLCGSLTEEESTIAIKTPVPNTPFPLKKSLNKSVDTSVSLREFSLGPRQVKKASDKMAKNQPFLSAMIRVWNWDPRKQIPRAKRNQIKVAVRKRKIQEMT